METYRVVQSLNHDGVDYVPGTTVDLEDENAAYLLAYGAIARETMPETPAKTTKTAARKKS